MTARGGSPVERQIELCEPRRGERDGLAALQDRFDQPRAQEGEVDRGCGVG